MKTKLRAKKAIEKITAAREGRKSMKGIRTMNSTTAAKPMRAESQDVIPTVSNLMNKTSSAYELPKVVDRRGLTVTGGMTTDGDSETQMS